jgi:hypothetical protein
MYEKDAAGSLVEDRARQARRADLWMQRQDLSGYVLLGDPAARLPIAQVPRGVQVCGVEAIGPALVGFPTRASTAAPRMREPLEMEAAVMAYFRSSEAAEIIAQQYRISREELEGWVQTYREWGRRGLAQRR